MSNKFPFMAIKKAASATSSIKLNKHLLYLPLNSGQRNLINDINVFALFFQFLLLWRKVGMRPTNIFL
jgi:hypothetical protein